MMEQKEDCHIYLPVYMYSVFHIECMDTVVSEVSWPLILYSFVCCVELQDVLLTSLYCIYR